MSSEEALARLAAEEQQLQFTLFNPDTAWQLGCALRQEAGRRGLHVTIDIQFAGQTLFHCAMPGTSPDNAEWIRRKRNVVLRFQRSSYAMGMRLTLRNTTLEAFYGLDPADYASQGGSFPYVSSTAAASAPSAYPARPSWTTICWSVRLLPAFLALTNKNLPNG